MRVWHFYATFAVNLLHMGKTQKTTPPPQRPNLFTEEKNVEPPVLFGQPGVVPVTGPTLTPESVREPKLLEWAEKDAQALLDTLEEDPDRLVEMYVGLKAYFDKYGTALLGKLLSTVVTAAHGLGTKEALGAKITLKGNKPVVDLSGYPDFVERKERYDEALEALNNHETAVADEAKSAADAVREKHAGRTQHLKDRLDLAKADLESVEKMLAKRDDTPISDYTPKSISITYPKK